MADDNTTLALLTTNNLRSLRTILDEFGDISGLRCNYDKTCILKVGLDPDPVQAEPLNLHGFVCTDSITLLGMEVKKNLNNVDDIFLALKEKILGIIRFWELFKLTLPGRISIVKTLLLPQLNYLGCILKPSDQVLTGLQSVIDNFAVKNLRVAANRLYLPAENGGLGLIRLETYLDAQRCMWISRANKKCIDNWRFDLKKLAPNGDISRIRTSDVDPVRYPILYNIVSSFSKLVTGHAKINGNYKLAYLFENGAFTWGENERLIDRAFFGQNFYDRYADSIRGLRLIDCYQNGTFKTQQEFAAMGIPLNANMWLSLGGAVKKATKSYKKNDLLLETKQESLRQFLNKLKKGSKKIRTVLEKEAIDQSQPENLLIVESFARITHTTVPNTDCLKKILSSWNSFFLTNDFREFLFKQRNNTLGIGARVAHFDENVDERCTFCRLLYQETRQREDFIHLFRTCPITNGLLQNFFRRFRLPIQAPGPDPDNNFDKIFWYGIDGTEHSQALQLFFDIFRYCLWKFKTRRRLPRIIELSDIFLAILDTILAIKPKIRRKIFNHRLIANILQALG
jgi:hypothetical protein